METATTTMTGRGGSGAGGVPQVLRRLLLAAGALLALGPAIGCGPGQGGDGGEEALRGRVLPAPIPAVDFTLTDTRGEPFHFARETEGKVGLLFFGYTHCPDVCPIHMSNLGAVLSRFPGEVRDRIRVVFVSTDPERDSRERIREWLDHFDPRFAGLRGPKAKVDSIMIDLQLPPAVKEGEGEDYTVGHAAHVLAFTPDDSAHVVYPFGTRQEDWAHDLPRLVEGWGGS